MIAAMWLSFCLGVYGTVVWPRRKQADWITWLGLALLLGCAIAAAVIS